MDNLIVHVDNVTKTYGSGKSAVPVLKGISLTIEKGVIFGLLGPSGCGKTTLISCIAGRHGFNKGRILVFGEVPGTKKSRIPGPRLGFMPQDVSLVEELTVTETLRYFGLVSGMSLKAIKSRIKELLLLLNVTAANRAVLTLSGGQKRRTSLAATLMYKPELLVLDEPTVGLDPRLRLKIWKYMTNLTADKSMSVIITTHYIEEARMANSVGLMLNGQLMAQNNPNDLMREHGFSTLEDVFLKLCLEKGDDDEEGSQQPLDSVSVSSSQTSTVNVNGGDADKNLTISRVYRETTLVPSADKKCDVPLLAPKDLEQTSLTTKRTLNATDSLESSNSTMSSSENSNTHIVEVVAPTSCTKLLEKFSSWVEFPKFHRVIAVTYRNSARGFRHPGHVLIQFILPAVVIGIFALCVGKPPHDIQVSIVNEDVDNADLGGKFLHFLDPHIIRQVPFNNFEDAHKAAKDGHTWAVIHIKNNFSEAIIKRFTHCTLSNNDTLETSMIGLSLDYSNQQIALTLNFEVFKALEKFAKSILTRLGVNPQFGTLPLKYDNHVYGDLQMSFDQYMIPGVMICIVFFINMGTTALAFVVDRKAGTLERCTMMGVTFLELVLAQILSQIIIILTQICLILFAAFVVFQYSYCGTFMLTLTLLFVQGICGMCLGILYSWLCQEESTTAVLCVFTFLGFILLSGLIWPVEAAPGMVRHAIQLLPQTFAMDAMRSIVNRCWGVVYYPIYMSFAISFAWMVVLTFVSWLFYLHRD